MSRPSHIATRWGNQEKYRTDHHLLSNDYNAMNIKLCLLSYDVGQSEGCRKAWLNVPERRGAEGEMGVLGREKEKTIAGRGNSMC